MSVKLTKKNLQTFNRLYGTVHFTCEILEKMAGPDGKPQSLSQQDIDEIKVMTRQAACAANSLDATHDERVSYD